MGPRNARKPSVSGGGDPLPTGRYRWRHVAVGGPLEIQRRIEEFKAVGVSKFVLRPIAAGDDDVMAQTERLIEDVLPAVHG